MINSTLKKLGLAVTLTGMVFGLARCGGSSNSSNTASFSYIYSNTLNKSCTQCHTASVTTAQDSAGLDFSSQATAYSGLTSRTVNGTTARTDCSTVHLVVADSPSTSYLMGAITTGVFNVSGCTPVYSGVHDGLGLSSDEISGIQAWINAGAPND